jgi:hypothetical protein
MNFFIYLDLHIDKYLHVLKGFDSWGAKVKWFCNWGLKLDKGKNLTATYIYIHKHKTII